MEAKKLEHPEACPSCGKADCFALRLHVAQLERRIAALEELNRLLAASTTRKNPLAVALGRLGGLKGGKARAEKMTQSERTEIASRAAKARWSARRKR